MKFGVILPNYGSDSTVEEMLAVTQTAERLNFDSVWATDHILLPENEAQRFGLLFEVMTTLAFLAGSTNGIRLGISALVLPLRDPILVAKQLATLDRLSNGRVMVCVAAGWAEGEFSNLGQSFSNRGRRLDEGIDLLRLLWKSKEDDPITFEGQYYRFKKAIFSPKPAQDGGPVLWVGGNSTAAQTRAVTKADGWHPTSTSFDKFRESALRIQDRASSGDWTLSARMTVSFDRSVSHAQFQGDSEEIIKTLRKFQSAGLEYPVLTFPGPTSKDRIAALERFAETVIPAFIENQ